MPAATEGKTRPLNGMLRELRQPDRRCRLARIVDENAAKHAKEIAMSQHHNILVVDDDEYVLKALERQLERSGYPVLTARSGDEALGKLACFDCSLIISDHLMPDMMGLDLLKVVRERYPRVVRMMLTGHADLETAIDAINSGEIFRFLVKPWELDVMLSTVSLALERVERERDEKRIIDRARRESHTLDDLEHHFPGITTVKRDAHGAIVIR